MLSISGNTFAQDGETHLHRQAFLVLRGPKFCVSEKYASEIVIYRQLNA